MRRGTLRNSALVIAVAAALMACGSSNSDSLNNNQANGAPGDPSQGTDPGAGGTTQNPGTPGDNGQAILDSRVTDYGEALRIASLKLVGDVPTYDTISKLAAITDPTAQKTFYEAQIDAMLADARFAPMMIQWWRDTLKTGQVGAVKAPIPTFDTAATFAASVVINDLPFTTIFTATNGTCPTFTPGTGGAAGTFTAADCTGTQPTAGILTDPGLMSQYYSNMAMRRTRFVQETFDCQKFPAEISTTPTPMGAGTYTSPWDFNSITGGATAKINFQDTSSVICADCHTTINHIAPMFGHFDANGVYNATAFEVQTPVPGNPTSLLTDWLPAGQGFAWRYQKPVTDIPSLGAAIAADPDVARCAVTRMYDWAMSRGDVVNDLATVPTEISDPYLADFTAGGLKMKAMMAEIFKSDDFTKF